MKVLKKVEIQTGTIEINKEKTNITMSLRRIQTLSLDTEKFATIKMPLTSDYYKLYIQNFGRGTNLQPIVVIKASKVGQINSDLYDISTGERL